MPKPVLYILTGPTASGKSAAAVAVARLMDGEIISADAFQIYRGLDIGSAKPTREEMGSIPHHMTDILSPLDDGYSVVRYREDALLCIADIISRGKKPILCGGTGLYINSLTYPLAFAPAPGDAAVRARLEAMEQGEKGSAHRMLAKVDKASAARLHPNDVKRVIRALEVYEATGVPMSEYAADFARRDDGALPYEVKAAALTMPRELLYARIDARVDAMLAAGLTDEVRALLESGVTTGHKALQGIGYKETARYLAGEYGIDVLGEEIKRETRRYAKRQMTWLRRDGRIRWFDVTEPGRIEERLTAYYLDTAQGGAGEY